MHEQKPITLTFQYKYNVIFRRTNVTTTDNLQAPGYFGLD